MKDGGFGVPIVAGQLSSVQSFSLGFCWQSEPTTGTLLLMKLVLPQLIAASLLLFIGLPASAHDPKVHTSRVNGRPMALPKSDDMFHFVIYGDRTGGVPEGIHVLEQAVTDTNLLDPDLVMTVGDLVQGYNEPPQWMEQMQEFRGVMGKLAMPWFPVAGNHDIYWRPTAGGDAPPPQEHEDNYEKHFGPLWYWFEHKRTGFLVRRLVLMPGRAAAALEEHQKVIEAMIAGDAERAEQ